MDQVVSPIDVYCQETVIGKAAKALLSALNPPLKSYTSTDIGVNRETPRVETSFQLGGAASQNEAVTDPATGKQELLECAWNGTLTLQVIVPVEGEGSGVSMLDEWVARTRAEVSHWRTKLDAKCPFYSFVWVQHQGTTPMFKTDKGFLARTLRYSVLFTLLPGCLTELAQAQQQPQPQ